MYYFAQIPVRHVCRASPLNVLFDGSSNNQPVDRRWPCLSTPMHAVHGLCFHCGVKERLQQEDMVGFDLRWRTMMGANKSSGHMGEKAPCIGYGESRNLRDRSIDSCLKPISTTAAVAAAAGSHRNDCTQMIAP